jgi:hypothetical protein
VDERNDIEMAEIRDIGKLVKHEFDCMENHAPNYSEDVAIFVASNGLSAHGNCQKYLEKMEPPTLYLGWNGKIYPRFEYVDMSIKLWLSEEENANDVEQNSTRTKVEQKDCAQDAR